MSAALAIIGGSDAEDIDGNRGAEGKVKAAARLIKDYEPAKPSVVRATLLKLEQALRRARAADKALRENGLLTSGLLEQLKTIERKAKTKASAMRPRRSGGLKIAGQKNKRAAQLAFDLLQDHGFTPTLTVGGPYLTLTALLFKMATGQDRDPTRACTAVCEDLGWRGGEVVRELRRQMEPFIRQMPDDEFARFARLLGMSRRGD
jgi:hypothetical protein